MSFEFLVGDLLFCGHFGDVIDVSLDVADPFAGVGFVLLEDGFGADVSLLAHQFSTGFTSLLVHSAGGIADQSGVGVDDVEGSGVSEGVEFLGVVEDSVDLRVADGGLVFVGVDDSGDVGVGDLVGGEAPSFLLGAVLGVGSEDVVEFLEGALGPDDKSADMSSGGELEEVESADVSDFDSGDVSECLDEGDVGSAVDDQRSSSGSVSSVSEFSLSGSDLDGVDDFLDISPGSDVSEESHGFLGAFDFLSGIGHNEREFGDGIDSVSSGLDEREDGGCGEGGGNGVSFLFEVASSVPSSPDSDGCEHSSFTAHVSEGTLSVSGGS